MAAALAEASPAVAEFGYVSEWSVPSGGTGTPHNPTDLATDAQGNVYVTDSTHAKVSKYSPNGEFLGEFGRKWVHPAPLAVGDLTDPRGIDVGPNGRVYVVDNANITEFTASGQPVTNSSQAEGRSTSGYGIAVSPSGDIYITQLGIPSWRVVVYGSDLREKGTFGAFTGANAVDVDAAGNVYVLEQGGARVNKFDAEGTPITSWGSFGNGPGQFNQALGLAVDARGAVWVADTKNDRVQAFGSGGEFALQFGCRGYEPGQFIEPRAVGTDSQGNVYVLDSTGRVQKFAEGGAPLRSCDADAVKIEVKAEQGVPVDRIKPKVYCRQAKECNVEISGEVVAKSSSPKAVRGSRKTFELIPSVERVGGFQSKKLKVRLPTKKRKKVEAILGDGGLATAKLLFTGVGGNASSPGATRVSIELED